MSTKSGSTDCKSADNSYSLWTCSLTRQEQNLGFGVIVQLDSGDKELQSLLPCLGAKLSQLKVDLQTKYALLTCHSNLHVVEDDQPLNLNGLQARVGSARDTVTIALEDCVSCSVSCCGTTSMLMLSSSAHAPAAYSLLPHTLSSGPCPIGYDFMILFLDEGLTFQPGKSNLPPVVKVSQCLNLASLQMCLAKQSGTPSWNSTAVGELCLCSRQTSGINMVPVKVPYSEEKKEVKRFSDEIDWYEKHQRLEYNCCDDLQSFNGAPIIYWHEGEGSLVGISSTGNQVITFYGICRLLAGGPVPLFAAMRAPSPRPLWPFRWSHHILPHLKNNPIVLATGTMINKAHLLEILFLLVKKEEGKALLNLRTGTPMIDLVTAMKILSGILEKFSGPEELKDVIRQSHVFELPDMSEDDFKECILWVCRKLNVLMQHFSSVNQGSNPRTILESAFHCTETMLYWSSQYPDAAEILLSDKNIKSADIATEKYKDSKPINNSFKRMTKQKMELMRQLIDTLQKENQGMKKEMEGMSEQIATLQKEIEELKMKESSKDRAESKGMMKQEFERMREQIATLQKEIEKLKKKERSEEPKPAYGKSLSTEPFTSKYPDGVQSAPELPDLMNEVAAKIPHKWREVGIQLGVEYDKLQSTPPDSCNWVFATVFTTWKCCMKKDYTWAVLIKVLKTPAVNEPKLAQKLFTMLTV